MRQAARAGQAVRDSRGRNVLTSHYVLELYCIYELYLEVDRFVSRLMI